MCTISMVPANGTYIFTFNRDEKPERHTPHFIVHKKLPHKQIYFTQDSKAGGSWFVADNLGNVIVLFNGAFEKHLKKDTYKKSRGIILLEIATANIMLQHFKNTLLTDVEPFSIILFEEKKMYRLTWDGMQKHETQLPLQTSYIFSSATLYDATVQQQRREWLTSFLKQSNVINAETILNFHRTYNKADKENGLVIERQQSCATLSISQAVVTNTIMQLQHIDLKTGQLHQQFVLLN